MAEIYIGKYRVTLHQFDVCTPDFISAGRYPGSDDIKALAGITPYLTFSEEYETEDADLFSDWQEYLVSTPTVEEWKEAAVDELYWELDQGIEAYFPEKYWILISAVNLKLLCQEVIDELDQDWIAKGGAVDDLECWDYCPKMWFELEVQEVD